MKTMMKLACVFALIASVGCSKGKPSCEEVFAHTKSLAPAEMRDLFEQNKQDAIAKCEKMSDEAKSCAMKAKTLEELQKCPRE